MRIMCDRRLDFTALSRELGQDFAVTYAKAVVTRLPQMVTRPEMLDWCKRNSSLMTTLALLK